MNENNFVNLTPHEINMYDPSGESLIATFPPSGVVARVNEESSFYQRGIFKFSKKEYTSLYFSDPNFVLDTEMYNIVSTFCMNAVPEKDRGVVFVSPDTGPDSVIRDSDGKIIGVRGFQY